MACPKTALTGLFRRLSGSMGFINGVETEESVSSSSLVVLFGVLKNLWNKTAALIFLRRLTGVEVVIGDEALISETDSDKEDLFRLTLGRELDLAEEIVVSEGV